MRIAALLTLPLLAACEYTYAVHRQVLAPPDFTFSQIEPTLAHHPGFSTAESDADEGNCLVRDADALARVSFDGRLLWIGSVWISRQPTPDVLGRSLDLQSRLIQIIRSAMPSIPAEEAWRIEWVNVMPPVATPDAPQEGSS